MEAFELISPEWTQSAVHAATFQCPKCSASSKAAKQVWINRRSPVFTADHRRKWQEFYRCSCETVWWGWSSDRPPSELANQERELPPSRFDLFEE
ncbi:MAG: hypothetical protein LH647_02640 [Leptolyngbyaceae cyanobacterium CAN_BIN12]|nr:hypothetical protein [Leptolyngbyaceae cyanobacterium CAN_BIN12]